MNTWKSRIGIWIRDAWHSEWSKLLIAAGIIGGFVFVAAGDKKPEDVFKHLDTSAEKIIGRLERIESTLVSIEHKLGPAE